MPEREEEVVRELELPLLHSSWSTKPLDQACPRLEEPQPRTPQGTLPPLRAPSGLTGEAAACREALLAALLPSLSWQGMRWPAVPLSYCQTTKLCHLIKLYSAGSLYHYTS